MNKQQAGLEEENEMSDVDQEETETERTDLDDLHNYRLTRDRVRRQMKVPSRYAQAEVVSFALNVAEEIGVLEPQSYKKAMSKMIGKTQGSRN